MPLKCTILWHMNPLTQIVNEDEGSWLSYREDGKGEFFNSNPNNPARNEHEEPAPKYCSQNQRRFLPYRLKAFELEEAAKIENPIELE
jgi:hypothetical protein